MYSPQIKAVIRPIREGFYIALGVLLCGGTGIVWFYFQSYHAQIRTMRTGLEQLTAAAAILVDGELHRTLVSPSQSGGAAHQNALAPLVRFHQAIPAIARLYTCVLVRDEVHFVLDTSLSATDPGRSRISQPRRIMDLEQKPDAALVRALQEGGATSSEQPYADASGTWISGYSPFFDTRGRRIGVVRIDLPLADFDKPLGVIRQVAFGATAGILAIALLSGAAVWMLRRRAVEMQWRNLVAQAELKKSEQRFRDVAGAAGEYIWETDSSGTYSFLSERVTTVMGYTPEEMLGKRPFEFVYEEDQSEARHNQAFHLLSKEPFHELIHRKVTKSGAAIWVEVNGVPILDEEGRWLGFRGTGLNITARKTVEADLIRAKEAAEQGDRAKGEFLAVMSHEIRTPMNGVIGFANILADTQLDGQQKEYVDIIKNSAESLLVLINDVLDFSKIESGQLELETNPLSIRKCVEDVISLNAQTAGSKNLELIHDIESDVPEAILGDEPRIRQILLNLVSNAIKFTAAGEVAVRVGCTPSSQQKGRARVSFEIQDTGIGIDPAGQERLFKPFSQADSSTTRKYGGTGLGLVISKRLVELMGGSISVVSRPGEGSTFKFHIFAPAADVAPEENPSLEALKDKRVLLVDDNATCRRVLSRQFIRWGMIPSTCSTPYEALDVLREKRHYQIAVVDMDMPGMDGLQFARKIRETIGAEVLSMILLTPFGQRDAGLKGRAAGYQSTIPKPFRQAQLLETITHILAGPDPSLPQILTTTERRTRKITLAASIGPRHPLKILLAEDNPVNQKVVSLMLNKIGYGIDLAANGMLVLQALEQQSYDLVLMDIQMPEMDGLEATRRIRAREAATPNSRPVYIIALTANALMSDRERCLEAGMNDYLSKPIRPPDLQAALQRCAQVVGMN